jgi:hypothetical protein
LFLLAAAGGYWLQRGSESPGDDQAGGSSAPEIPPGSSQTSDPPSAEPGDGGLLAGEIVPETPGDGLGTVPPLAGEEEPTGGGASSSGGSGSTSGGGGSSSGGGGSTSSGGGLAGSGRPPAPPGLETTENAPPEKEPIDFGAGGTAIDQETATVEIPPEPPPQDPLPGAGSSETQETAGTTITPGTGAFGSAQPGATPQPPPQPPAPPAPAEEGIIYWTGRLQKDQVIVIELGRASGGQAEGALPGTPVDVWLPSPAVALTERPNPKNNWSRVSFRCRQNTRQSVTINVQWRRLR